MTRKELLDKLKNIERDVKEIREFLSQDERRQTASAVSPLGTEQDFKLKYTLDDLYREFGG